MSLSSWKKEFYSTPANKVSKRFALKHSLKKWLGLKPANRKKHNVSFEDSDLVNTSDVEEAVDGANVKRFEFTDETCALCQHFRGSDDECKECPLTKAGISRCSDSYSPFGSFVNNDNIVPMINALKKALKKQEEKV